MDASPPLSPEKENSPDQDISVLPLATSSVQDDDNSSDSSPEKAETVKNEKEQVDDSDEENKINDMHEVFGDDMDSSSSDESSDDDSAEEVQSDYEQQAKNKLQKIVAKKKRLTKKDKSEEPPKKKRRLPGEKKEKVVRPKKRERTQEEISKLVSDLLDKMKEAYDSDLINMQTKRPGLKKLELLPEMEQKLSNKSLQRHFVESHILDELGKWMKPHSDKSLPNLSIRKMILKTLYSLDVGLISVEVLKDSGVGKFVHLYSIHPKETRENKMLAEKILNKWLELNRRRRT